MAVKFSIPKNVSKETGAFMKNVIKELNQKNVIQNIDLGAIKMLCVSYEMYLQASEILLDEGCILVNKYGDRIPNPAQTIATKNYAQVIKIMTEYGLTIKSRTSMKSVNDGDKEESPLDKFLRDKK